MSIPGLDYKASEEARSKRDAQTNAAWNFCDEMVRTGYMKKKDLPPRFIVCIWVSCAATVCFGTRLRINQGA